MYFQISTVKSNINTLHPTLKNFQPRKKETLTELIKEAQKEIADKKLCGFITASEFSGNKNFPDYTLIKHQHWFNL